MTLGDFAVRGPVGSVHALRQAIQGIRLLGRRGKANVGLVAATVPRVSSRRSTSSVWRASRVPMFFGRQARRSTSPWWLEPSVSGSMGSCSSGERTGLPGRLCRFHPHLHRAARINQSLAHHGRLPDQLTAVPPQCVSAAEMGWGSRRPKLVRADSVPAPESHCGA